MSGAAVLGDTTQQHKTHKTQLRTVAYRWHPLYGREVSIRSSYERQGVAMYRCHLDGYRSGRRFDLPQWMFDSTRCAAMCLADQPRTSLAALQAMGNRFIKPVFPCGVLATMLMA